MKYRNVPRRYGDRLYHSSLESRYAQTLDLLLKAKEIISWQSQPVFRLKVNGNLICKIIPDFLVTTKHGGQEIHETKAWITQTPEWRVKWKLMQALYPEYKYKVITKYEVAH